jgi:hypothetical protein
MRRHHRAKVASLCLATLAAAAGGVASGQGWGNWPPGLEPAVIWDKAILGVPSTNSFGGMCFDAAGSTMYLGIHANTAAGQIVSYAVQRDQAQKITGFVGPSGAVAAPNIDGGLAFGPGGVLCWTAYPLNTLGQWDPVSGSTVSIPLPATVASVGGLCFPPPGSPIAGSILVSSYDQGSIRAYPLVPIGNGFHNIGTESVYAVTTTGNEGMAFGLAGPYAGDLFFANYDTGALRIVRVDPTTGLALGGWANPTLVTLVSYIGNLQGVAFDPVTADLFVSIYGAYVYRVDDVVALQALNGSQTSVSAAAGVPVDLAIRMGSSQASRTYVVGATGSGTIPGTQIGSVLVPLNWDPILDFVIQNLNTGLFTNFFGTTNAFGAAHATLDLPPFALGGPISFDFAAVTGTPSGLTAASNAFHLVIVP